MSVLAIVTARSGSKGIPGKNTRMLGGLTLIEHALRCAHAAGCSAVLSTDIALLPTNDHAWWVDSGAGVLAKLNYLQRPPELAQDDTPMIDVVQHVLEHVPGPDDQIIVLLQPTQPFRTAQHVQQAIALLRETQADSVVSVVELPKTYHPHMQIECRGGRLYPFYQGTHEELDDDSPKHWGRRSTHWAQAFPACRQSLRDTYRRDGTVYAFWRETVRCSGNIYGQDVVPLIIPAAETCELDTLEDWAEAERRWAARA